MITFEQARQIAIAEIAKALPKYDFVLLEDEILTRPYGWVFYYTSRKHRETGNIMDSVPGNAPFLVTKGEGAVHFLPTGVPFPIALKEVERIIGYTP